MDIRIKSIKLLNFKGQREATLELDGQNKSLLGANATGKTTMFDAFMWTLFGKDSKGAAQFDIKTLTPDGEVLWKLPHSATVELLVDGKLTTLRREYEEKWVKARGETEETFRGHEVNRFWNDVPCSAAEFDTKVAELCDESLFRLITNPAHFNSLDDKEKMRLLNTLEGNTTDEQFIASTPEFADFLHVLNGKTLDEYKRGLASKISRTNAEIESCHTRLDEVKRGVPEEQDWAEIELGIVECDGQIARIKELRADVAKQSEEQARVRMGIQSDINAESLRLQARKQEIREEVLSGYEERESKRREQIRRRESLCAQLQAIEKDQDKACDELTRLSEELEKLSGEYKAIHAEKFEFDDAAAVCPTCKQHLPVDDVEKLRQQLLENFNVDRARRLSENTRKGQSKSDELGRLEELIKKSTEEVARLDAEIANIETDPIMTEQLIAPDPQPFLDTDPVVREIQAKIDALRKRLDEVPATAVSTEYDAEERQWQTKKSELERKLYVRDTIAAAHKRIAELETSIKTNGQHLLDLERDAETIKEIKKAKALSVEARINSMFSLVRFKMVADQINGGDRQVCETTVGGVPYQSLNNAARINAGLDIINAFCRYHGITAPVFVDNAEAVNELMPMQSQVISLVVTTDKQLTVV